MIKYKWLLMPMIIFLTFGLFFAGVVASTPDPPSENSPPDNLALNPSRSGYPHPTESSTGWGGGSDKWDIVDGIRKEATWNNGLAFTGGISSYYGTCGWRQATINFGMATTFNRVMVWHHDLSHVPNTYKIQYFDGYGWIDVFSTDNGNGHDYLVYPADPVSNWYESFSTPTENRFDPVTSEKVRFELWNCDIVHGWIYEFEVYLTDDEGPITANIAADPNPVPVGSSVNLMATIDDRLTGGSDVASAEYSLDSGATWISMSGDFDSPMVDVSAQIGPFTEPQVIDILVRGTDAAGNVGEPASVLLAVYDPSAGFVTGGGWIWSPASAYASQPELEGRATFGFVSRYKKGQSTPDGNTQFQFRAADLNFRSTDYAWLVIAGSRAQFKGSGTINGEGDFGFMLTAIDGNLTPSQDYDSFRIKIWEKTTEEVIYDNHMGKSDSGDYATALGGGSIVIHSGK